MFQSPPMRVPPQRSLPEVPHCCLLTPTLVHARSPILSSQLKINVTCVHWCLSQTVFLNWVKMSKSFVAVTVTVVILK